MSIARFSDIVHYLHCPVVGQWILDPDLVRCSRSGSREPQHVSAAGHPSPLFIGDGHKTTFAPATPCVSAVSDVGSGSPPELTDCEDLFRRSRVEYLQRDETRA